MTNTRARRRRPAKNSRSGTRRNAGQFRKGQSGNPAGRPKGVPNTATVEVKALCQRLVTDPEYQRKLERAWRARRLPHQLEQMIWHFAYGRPTQHVELSERPPRLEEIIAGVRGEEMGRPLSTREH